MASDITQNLDAIEAKIRLRKAGPGVAETVTFDGVRASIDAAVGVGVDGAAAAHLRKAAQDLDALRKNYEGPTPVPAGAGAEVQSVGTVEQGPTPDPTATATSATNFSSNAPDMVPASPPAATGGQMVPSPAGASGAPFATPAIGKSWSELDQEYQWPANYGLGGKPRGLSGVE